MGFISNPGSTSLSGLTIDTDLAMGAHDITLNDSQTVDGIDVNSHDAAAHTNITRKLFLPVSGCTVAISKGIWWGCDCDGAAESAFRAFTPPIDFVSALALKMVFIANTTTNVVGDSYIYSVADDEGYSSGASNETNITYKTSPTANDLYIVSTGVTISGIAANDIVTLNFSLDSGDIHFIGWIFEYTANQ